MHKLKEPQVKREFLLCNAPMRTKPTAQERPKAFHGIHMDFTQAVTIFITGEFASSMVHTLMAVSPGLQTSINAVLIRINQCTGNDGVFNKGLGYPRKAGHPVASTSERHGLVSFPRPWQIIDVR